MAKQRMVFLDVLRGIAVFWMVETHVIDVCLAPTHHEGLLLTALKLSNGFVAVTFIFCAGAAFWLVGSKKEDDFRRLGPGFQKYLKRILFILLLGYLMHLPTPSFRELLAAPHEIWRSFLAIDVLQLIAYASLLTLLVFWAVRPVRWLPLAAALLAVGLFAATPYVWRWDAHQHLPLSLAGILGRQPTVMFPLFPWAGYFFAGLALAGSTAWLQARPQWAALGAGVALALGAWGLSQQSHLVTDWWYFAPAYLLFRIGITVAIYLALMLLFQRMGERRFWVVRGLEIAGQESLFLYLTHVFLVYAVSFGGLSLRTWAGGQLSLVQSLGVFVAIMAFVYLGMLVYRFFKQKYPVYTAWAKYGGVTLLIVQFLLK